MIPWISWQTISLGPLSLQVWGLMVALGFLVGTGVAGRLAASRGLKSKPLYDAAAWIIFGSMIGARLFHVVFYEPSFYLIHPVEALAFWHGGLSIYGGFVGALVAGYSYFKHHHLDFHSYADVMIFGLPIGMFFGRIGCFLIHDHPGTATDFFLGVRYPDGITRHDLGLYEALSALVLAAVFYLIARRQRRKGTFLPVFCLWYGSSRFLLDFLRAVDVRYLGLTPGQYFSLGLLGLGIVYVLKNKKLIFVLQNEEASDIESSGPR